MTVFFLQMTLAVLSPGKAVGCGFKVGTPCSFPHSKARQERQILLRQGLDVTFFHHHHHYNAVNFIVKSDVGWYRDSGVGDWSKSGSNPGCFLKGPWDLIHHHVGTDYPRLAVQPNGTKLGLPSVKSYYH